MKLASLIFLALIFLAPSAAFANVGVPMIGVTLVGMVFALAPIIIIEKYVLASWLGLSLWHSTWVMFSANLVSTLIGIPVTWFLLLLAQISTWDGVPLGIETISKKFLAVTWQAPWLVPYDDDLHWMIPAAALVLLVPFFFASWLVEYWVSYYLLYEGPSEQLSEAVFGVPFGVSNNLLNEVPSEKLSDAVFSGNLITYGILALLLLGVFIWEIRDALRDSLKGLSFNIRSAPAAILNGACGVGLLILGIYSIRWASETWPKLEFIGWSVFGVPVVGWGIYLILRSIGNLFKFSPNAELHQQPSVKREEKECIHLNDSNGSPPAINLNEPPFVKPTPTPVNGSGALNQTNCDASENICSDDSPQNGSAPEHNESPVAGGPGQGAEKG
jgi:hypothetical protein